MTLKPRTTGWMMVGGAVLTMFSFSPAVEPPELHVKPQPGTVVPPLVSRSGEILDADETRVIGELVRKIETTMAVKVSAQKTRDPDGRVGVFIDCSQPFLKPSNLPGMDLAKTWVLFAVFATLGSIEGLPVRVDYIGLTDPEGASGKKSYYELDVGAARQIQKEIFAGTITMEGGYDKIVAAWRLITRT